jgi:hypothetical protein
LGGDGIYQPWSSEEGHFSLTRKKVKWAEYVINFIGENYPDIKTSAQGPDDLFIPRSTS